MANTQIGEQAGNVHYSMIYNQSSTTTTSGSFYSALYCRPEYRILQTLDKKHRISADQDTRSLNILFGAANIAPGAMICFFELQILPLHANSKIVYVNLSVFRMSPSHIFAIQ